MRIRHTLIAAAFVAAAASPAPAGSIGAVEVGDALDWTSKCAAPVAPSPTFHDITGYNAALEAYNTYVARVRSYIRCVQADGKTDIDTLAAAIAERMQAQQNAAVAAAERLRTELEVQRALLR